MQTINRQLDALTQQLLQVLALLGQFLIVIDRPVEFHEINAEINLLLYATLQEAEELATFLGVVLDKILLLYQVLIHLSLDAIEVRIQQIPAIRRKRIDSGLAQLPINPHLDALSEK